MTGNVQPKFPMEHNMCWLQGMTNEKNYNNTRQHKPKNEHNNGGILAGACLMTRKLDTFWPC